MFKFSSIRQDFIDDISAGATSFDELSSYRKLQIAGKLASNQDIDVQADILSSAVANCGELLNPVFSSMQDIHHSYYVENMMMLCVLAYLQDDIEEEFGYALVEYNSTEAVAERTADQMGKVL